MKQMVYTAERNREVLDMGEYEGFTYAIISLGWHPCAYVKIPENHKYFKVDCDDLPMIDCHGGITYSESYLAVADGKDLDGWWIGWDYSHYMDFSGTSLRSGICIEGEKKYSTAEILSDVFNVIEQLKSDKYINYTKVKSGLKEDIYNILSVVGDDNHLKTEMIINILDKLPTENTVEIVRCKNCIHYKEGNLLSPNKFCFRLKHNGKYVGYNFSPDDFCSYGVKKDGEV